MNLELNKIYHGDCLDPENGMARLPDNSVDMILADLPYGTTACKWDSIIPLEPLWEQYERIIKDNGAIVLTASQPFTTKLISSNMEWFRYEWIWIKNRGNGIFNAKKMPMKAHENVLVFYNKLPTYNPQMRKGKPYKCKQGKQSNAYGLDTDEEIVTINSGERYPLSYIKYNSTNGKNEHPTQKPVKLFEYLIKTYTNEGELVMDNAIGSGTTAVAALKNNRKFVGWEQNKEYWEICQKRLGKLDKSYYEELPEDEKPKQQHLF